MHVFFFAASGIWWPPGGVARGGKSEVVLSPHPEGWAAVCARRGRGAGGALELLRGDPPRRRLQRPRWSSWPFHVGDPQGLVLVVIDRFDPE